jgi:hypothetical protein
MFLTVALFDDLLSFMLFETEREAQSVTVGGKCEKLAELKASGAALDLQFREFRTRYAIRLGRFGQITACRSDSLSGRAEIEARWRELLAQGARWRKSWNEALREVARAKEFENG